MTKMINKHYGPEFQIQQYLDETNLERIKINEEDEDDKYDEDGDDDKYADSLDVDDDGIGISDINDINEPRQSIT
jgi:hypothetical protein